MDRLEPVLFQDAWGSRTSLAELQNRPTPSAEPESELWMGAHESGPARLTRGGTSTNLLEVIAADPQGELGSTCHARYGPRLPFLLKILAPGQAISIQVHPSAAQARERIAIDGSRTYGDEWAKPEMLVALTPFRVFVGFREFAQVEAIAGRLQVERLTALIGAARTSANPVHALLESILRVEPDEQPQFVRDLIAAWARVADESDHDDELAQLGTAIVDIARTHPDDIGIAVLVVMHHRQLATGEYIDVPPGVLHSYVSGVGLEVLANSDNVVRAGLTSKEVNVEELLRIVDTDADGRVGRAQADPAVPAAHFHPTTSDRFELRRFTDAADLMLPGQGGPRLVFCLSGSATLTSADQELSLGPVESAYLGAREHPVQLSCTGDTYLVSAPPA